MEHGQGSLQIDKYAILKCNTQALESQNSTLFGQVCYLCCDSICHVSIHAISCRKHMDKLILRCFTLHRENYAATTLTKMWEMLWDWECLIHFHFCWAHDISLKSTTQYIVFPSTSEASTFPHSRSIWIGSAGVITWTEAERFVLWLISAMAQKQGWEKCKEMLLHYIWIASLILSF